MGYQCMVLILGSAQNRVLAETMEKVRGSKHFDFVAVSW